MPASKGLDELNGLDQLDSMGSQRRVRQAPPSRHPKADAEDVAAPPVLPQQSQPTPIEEPPVSTTTVTPPAASNTITSGITVYITEEAIEGARLMRLSGTTNADIALDAVEALQDQLRDLVKARRSGERRETRTGSTLFPSRAGTAARSSAPRRTMWAIRLTPAEIDVLDKLARSVGAASRSELVSVAVEAYVRGNSVHQ